MSQRGIGRRSHADKPARSARANAYRPTKNHRHLALIDAIRTVFPLGVGGISAKRRNRELNDHLVANGKDSASASAIVRALNDLASREVRRRRT
jgi:hypothetical protein